MVCHYQHLDKRSGVTRIAARPVTLGANYENAVNTTRLREQGEDAEYFRADALWNGKGERAGAYTVRHRESGRLYFAVKPAQMAVDTDVAESGTVAKVHRDKWIDNATGQELDVETIRDYLPPIHKAEKQDVEHDVLWRTIAVDSVRELIYGNHYIVSQPREVQHDNRQVIRQVNAFMRQTA